jgi:hypothetical protein
MVSVTPAYLIGLKGQRAVDEGTEECAVWWAGGAAALAGPALPAATSAATATTAAPNPRE